MCSVAPMNSHAEPMRSSQRQPLDYRDALRSLKTMFARQFTGMWRITACVSPCRIQTPLSVRSKAPTSLRVALEPECVKGIVTFG